VNDIQANRERKYTVYFLGDTTHAQLTQLKLCKFDAHFKEHAEGCKRNVLIDRLLREIRIISWASRRHSI